MSTQDNTHFKTLLPQATVALYSRDTGNAQTLSHLGEDWRFTRVTLQVHNGDVNQAIHDCQTGYAPNLLIIQNDVIDEDFAGQLENLAQHCPEGTGAIIIGPDNDINLYRRLMDMGVTDYLVHPLKPDVLAGVIAKALIQELGTTGSHLMAFIGAKGGVGTTALSAAMAWGVSEYMGHKTALLDGSGGWSAINVSMGLNPSANLLEAAQAAEAGDEETLARMLQNVSGSLDVLASGGNDSFYRPVTPAQLEKLHDILMTRYPFIITDLSDSSAGIKKVILNKAQQIAVVSTPTIPALRQARTLLSDIANLRGGESDGINLIINMQGMSGSNEISRKDIEEAVGEAVSAIIPFAPKLFIECESEGRRIIDEKDGAQIVKDQLIPLVGEANSADEKSGLLDRLMSSLTE